MGFDVDSTICGVSKRQKIIGPARRRLFRLGRLRRERPTVLTLFRVSTEKHNDGDTCERRCKDA
jgi:hypothetical protein